MSGSFFDSNVLLYLGYRETPKGRRAELLVREGGLISVQVLNECANVLRLKRKATWPETYAFLDEIRALLGIVPLTVDVHRTGLRLAERYGFSVYDGFIVAAALLAGCETLWSEDMHDGLLVEERLRIRNPFTA